MGLCPGEAMSDMKLSERLRFESHEYRLLDICIESSTFNQWADEAEKLEARLESMERQKNHWWVLACHRFADLTEIAESSDKEDDYEWYGTGMDRHIPVGIDESKQDDWHDHGFGMGVWSMAKKARKALATAQQEQSNE